MRSQRNRVPACRASIRLHPCNRGVLAGCPRLFFAFVFACFARSRFCLWLRGCSAMPAGASGVR